MIGEEKINEFTKEVVLQLEGEIQCILLTGSYSRYEVCESSDIDMWLFFKKVNFNILKTISNILKKLPKAPKLTPKCTTFEESLNKYFAKEYNPLQYRTDGIVLYGELKVPYPKREEFIEESKYLANYVIMGIRHYLAIGEDEDKLLKRKVQRRILKPLMWSLRYKYSANHGKYYKRLDELKSVCNVGEKELINIYKDALELSLIEYKGKVDDIFKLCCDVCKDIINCEYHKDRIKINRKNFYPTILVHGFMGWDREEIFGYKYWGGFEDLQENLIKEGYDIRTACVGPVASNWDRACELYAFIKGGTVDYGKVHSKKYGHKRYGRTYPGIYNKLGDKGKKGEINKVHLIGHSMGGQTIRVLDTLLANGCKEEFKGTDLKDLSPLFKGGHKWICSVTTISSPNDGTTLADEGNIMIKYAQDIFAYLGSVCENTKYNTFDFKLDQWGLKRYSGEDIVSYINRILKSNIWNKTKDIATWDLSTDGARELNKWLKIQDDGYYFSWTTKATKESSITGSVVPDIKNMNPLFIPNSILMSKYTNNSSKGVIIDGKWWHNDGYVNVISQDGPKIGSSDKIVRYNGNVKKGVWNKKGILNRTDHWRIIQGDKILWYKRILDELYKL